MLTFVFTPRSSPDIPAQIGPVPGVHIEGNTLRNARSGAVMAECEDQHWLIGGKPFYRADCAGPLKIKLEGCDAAPSGFGPFKHFSLSDGVAYVDRAVFAQLNSSNKWYVERARTECPRLLLVTS